RAKLEATDIEGLVNEFDYAPDDRPLQLIRDTLRLSSHVLSTYGSTLAGRFLAGELLARLPEGEESCRTPIIRQAKAGPGPWLRPLRPCLTGPGGPLVRTLAGHESRVEAAAVTLSGTRAVSASDDRTLKVWDLGSGRELQ